MKEKYFKWLSDSCFPRKGAKLEKGKVYKVEDYPADVVAEWVKQKSAKYIKDKSKEEDE